MPQTLTKQSETQPFKILVYSTRPELREMIDRVAGLDFITVTDDINTAKDELSSEKYLMLISDLTIYDHESRLLLNWENSSKRNIATFLMAQSAKPIISAETWRMYDDHMFHHTGSVTDNLTVPLDILIHNNSDLLWVNSVQNDLNRLNSRLLKGPGQIVLMKGAGGTAKLSIAQIAHFHSGSRYAPFVFVNCSLRSQRATEKTVWQESDRREFMKILSMIMKQGANGTVFFRDFDELDFDAQEVLGDVLEKAVRCNDRTQVPGIIFCATKNNIEEGVRSRLSPAKLVNLLTNSVVRVPSLSDYKENIGDFANELLKYYCMSERLPERTLSEDARNALCNNIWSNNIRELFCVLKHAVVLSKKAEITAGELRLDIQLDPKDTTEDKAYLIKKALHKYNGVKKKAADCLGISRKTLYKWMEELGIAKDYK